MIEMIHPSNTRHLFVPRDMWDFMDSEVTGYFPVSGYLVP